MNPTRGYNIQQFKNRIEFGFTNDINIYFCMQSPFKFHVEFDYIMIEILKRNRNNVIILLNGFQNKILKRFENSGVVSQIHIFSHQTHIDYLNIMYISDVILDTFPFGGCNSSLEAFSLNKPVITMPSDMINGRFTYGFYKKMNIMDLICTTKEKYIEKSIELIENKDMYYRITNEIKIKNNILFEDVDTIDEWKDTIIKLTKYI